LLAVSIFLSAISALICGNFVEICKNNKYNIRVYRGGGGDNGPGWVASNLCKEKDFMDRSVLFIGHLFALTEHALQLID
jgi:hypothetical protein